MSYLKAIQPVMSIDDFNETVQSGLELDAYWVEPRVSFRSVTSVPDLGLLPSGDGRITTLGDWYECRLYGPMPNGDEQRFQIHALRHAVDASKVRVSVRYGASGNVANCITEILDKPGSIELWLDASGDLWLKPTSPARLGTPSVRA